jgi:hypothetical protein
MQLAGPGPLAPPCAPPQCQCPPILLLSSHSSHRPPPPRASP